MTTTNAPAPHALPGRQALYLACIAGIAAILATTTTPAYAQNTGNTAAICVEQDATGVGPCTLLLGYRWDGQACEGISGCTCEGEDCDALSATLDECRERYCRCLCEPQDAQGYGVCTVILGYRWTGATCEAVGGCDCLGEDCGNLFMTYDFCLDAHQACPCAAQDAQAEGDCEAILGYAWNGQQCEALVGCECTGDDCDDIGSLADCYKNYRPCLCREQDARGVGPCDLFLGYRWDGEQCVGESGCNCEGPACNALYDTLEFCEAVHADCPCRAQAADGVGPCDQFFGYRWTGARCESVSGCECIGSDCDDLYPTHNACKFANRGCRCRAQDAYVFGPCDFFFGYRWDGFECVPLSGCDCLGGDCDELHHSLDTCVNSHHSCKCRIQDAAGIGPCDQFFGYAWDGYDCVGVSGCECSGSDCDALFDSIETCLNVHRGCDPCSGCVSCADPWGPVHRTVPTMKSATRP